MIISIVQAIYIHVGKHPQGDSYGPVVKNLPCNAEDMIPGLGSSHMPEGI